MITVRDIYNEIDRLIPFSSKESWDNCGMLAGDLSGKVTKIITALDITKEVIREAEEKGAELIISHHPVIFSPLKAVNADTPVGMLLSKGISAICTHTPFDMSPLGMNKGLYDLLSGPLGLMPCPVPLDDMGEGRAVGMIYELEEPLSTREAAQRAKEALGCTCVRFSGDSTIKRIAISSGSGNGFVSLAAAKGADALLSGDLKHDSFVDSQSIDGISLIDCGHFHTERIFCTLMKNILSEAFPTLDISEARSCTDPVQYII